MVCIIQCRLNRRPRPAAVVHVRSSLAPVLVSPATRRVGIPRIAAEIASSGEGPVRGKQCVLNLLFAALSVCHGVNGESVGGDAPCRGYLGDGGEFRCRVRPGSGHEHRRLDETTGGSISLLRHEGFGSRHGIYSHSVSLDMYRDPCACFESSR